MIEEKCPSAEVSDLVPCTGVTDAILLHLLLNVENVERNFCLTTYLLIIRITPPSPC
jgi:hypothetical protein